MSSNRGMTYFNEKQLKEHENDKYRWFTNDELQQPIKTVRPGKRREMPKPETFVRSDRKTGRNEPCPCGSGLKYKRCHQQHDKKISGGRQ